MSLSEEKIKGLARDIDIPFSKHSEFSDFRNDDVILLCRAIEAAVREEQDAEIARLREKVAQLEDYKAKTGLAYKGSEQETRDKLAAAQATIAQMREANAELLEGLRLAAKWARAGATGTVATHCEELIAKHGGKEG